MPVEFDIRPIVEKNSALPMERLRVVNRFEEVGIAAIQRGVIFVFAAWSAPASAGFRRFTEIVNALPTTALDLIVLDTDCLNTDTAAQLFGVSGFQAGGWGETLWVRDGVIVAREFASRASEQSLRKATMELLDGHNGEDG